jgi:hypothetical protein
MPNQLADRKSSVILRPLSRFTGGASLRYHSVPLDPSFFMRGARFKTVSSGLLLEESIRFFNVGLGDSPGRTQGTRSSGNGDDELRGVIRKEFVPISPYSLETAILEYGSLSSRYLYDHLKSIYEGFVTRPKTSAPVKFESLIHQSGNPYIKAAAQDKRLRVMLIARLLCDRWATEEGKKEILQFSAVAKSHNRSVTLLKRMDGADFAPVEQQTDQDNARLPESALVSSKWVGAAHTATFEGISDASLLATFAPGGVLSELGLAEKVHTTLSLLCGYFAPIPKSHRPRFEPNAYWWTTQDAETDFETEITKLHTRAFGHERAGQPQFARWMGNLIDLENVVFNMIERYRELGLVSPSDPQYGHIRSDLLWASLLICYLRLFLLRVQSLALIASIPFRQLYEGGSWSPFGAPGKVDGIVGPLAILLWEYFSAVGNPHVLYASAKDCLPPYLLMTSGWVDSEKTLEAPDALKSAGPALEFEGYEIDVSDKNLSHTTRETWTAAKSGPAAPGKASPLQILAGVNYQRFPSQQEDEGRDEYLQRLREKELVKCLSFPPNGRFEPIEQNPPFLGRFFNLRVDQNGRQLRVFNPHSNGERSTESAFIYGAKLTAQLQTYVIAWLLDRAFDEAGWPSDVSDSNGQGRRFTSEVQFTCSNIQYGGKFPPHKSHRDGYGLDCSLVGRRLDPTERTQEGWHIAVQWPSDDKAVKDGEPPAAKSFMRRDVPVAFVANQVRRKLLAALDVQAIPREKRKQELAKREATVRRQLSKMMLPDVDEEKYQHKLKAWIARIPYQAEIVQSIDDYQRPDLVGAKEPIRRYVFGDWLSGLIKGELLQTEKNLRRGSPPTVTQIEEYFRELERWILDFPVFPNKESHRAHHIAHVAVALALPTEILWGAPLYHVRALRAILTVLAEYRNQGVRSPFSAVPKETKSPSEEAEYPAGWPLPLSHLYFAPGDHHHHWHIQFWNAGRYQTWQEQRSLSETISTHFDYVAACLPFWLMLGIDFQPFVEYLDYYSTKVVGSWSVETKQDVSNLKLMLKSEVEQFRRRSYKLLGDVAPSELRAAMFGRVFSYEKEVPAAYEERRTSPTPTEWPTKGSYLDRAIQESERIVKVLDDIHHNIDKLKVPEEIFEALDNNDVSDQQDRNLEGPFDRKKGFEPPLDGPPDLIDEKGKVMLDDKGDPLNDGLARRGAP